MSDEYTLHDAIMNAIGDIPEGLTAKEIAQRINTESKYKRKDGCPVPAVQISARIRKYPNLFMKTGSKIKNRI